MKKFFNDDDSLEKVVGGIFGVVAIVAAVVEIFLCGASTESIVAGIKDVSGTLIVVVLLLAFIKSHKKTKGIRGSIESGMEKLEEVYSPLIREATVTENSNEQKINKLKEVIRYEIASDIGVLFGKQSKSYAPFFDIDSENPTKVEFYIRKKFFSDTVENPFNAEKIYEHIYAYMIKRHDEYKITFLPDASGGKVVITFPAPLKYKKDIDELLEIVDDMIFIYTAENKK